MDGTDAGMFDWISSAQSGSLPVDSGSGLSTGSDSKVLADNPSVPDSCKHYNFSDRSLTVTDGMTSLLQFTALKQYTRFVAILFIEI